MEELCRPLVAKAGSVDGKGPQAGFLLRQLKNLSSVYISFYKPQGQRILAGYRQEVAKDRTRPSDQPFQHYMSFMLNHVPL